MNVTPSRLEQNLDVMIYMVTMWTFQWLCLTSKWSFLAVSATCPEAAGDVGQAQPCTV